jgi:diguanylate cyclase (GGDEF)-like protein
MAQSGTAERWQFRFAEFSDIHEPGQQAGNRVMEQRVVSVDPEALVAEVARLRGEVALLEARVEELEQLANTDSLVPVANRRGLIAQLDMMIARFERHGTPAALLFIDVDGLKALNDAFGHAAGDAALIHLTETIVASVRQTDVVARMGGDEFAILLDHADEASACETAGRLADQVAGREFCFDGTCLPLSIAIGFTPIQTGDSPESALDRADEAMYRQKDAA